MFDLLFQHLPAIFTGGATGLLGTALSVGTKFMVTRQQNAHELKLRAIDMEMIKLEAATVDRQAEAEAEIAEAQALRESYREAAARWSRPEDGAMMKAIDVVRGLTRPGLTWYFVLLLTVVFFTVATMQLRETIITTLLYLTTTCVLWWFGARLADKHMDRIARR
ncbi:MAG: hypothetical protein F4X97_10190 [Boseongicola sp. SB0662_bin_57]|nr:hypothetical protein [Boseongicola sp. SB0662_bin_57]